MFIVTCPLILQVVTFWKTCCVRLEKSHVALHITRRCLQFKMLFVARRLQIKQQKEYIFMH